MGNMSSCSQETIEFEKCTNGAWQSFVSYRFRMAINFQFSVSDRIMIELQFIDTIENEFVGCAHKTRPVMFTGPQSIYSECRITFITFVVVDKFIIFQNLMSRQNSSTNAMQFMKTEQLYIFIQFPVWLLRWVTLTSSSLLIIILFFFRSSFGNIITHLPK